MLIKEKRLRNIIKNILIESSSSKIPQGFSVYEKSSEKNEKKRISSRYNQFCSALKQKIQKTGKKIVSISVIDPNDIENEHGEIIDNVFSALSGNQTNNIYHDFGKKPEKDKIKDLFRSNGLTALDDFFDWAKSNFVDYEDYDIYFQGDMISAFYLGKQEKEYQVSIMFF